MKALKNALALLLALALMCSCAACGNTNSESTEAAETAAPETAAAETAPAETPAETAAAETPEETAAAEAVVTNYADEANWAFYAEGEGDADVFFVCPTVDGGADGNYNMRMDDEDTKSSFVGATEMELGIYDQNAVVYAPYYQQVSFPTYYLDAAEADPYFTIAYSDVKAAFEYYLEQCDPERPLILAGFSQGADMVLRLMKDCFDDSQLQDRLVAAYAIGWELTKDEVEACPWVVPAEGEDDTGCVVLFSSEAEEVTESIIVGADEWTYSINPLNWKTDSTPADASLNEGACFTNYSGEITQEILNFTGAYIDETRGVLKCPDVNPEDYSGSLFPDGVYHLYDYQFFYRNLQHNVATRLAAWEAEHA